MTKAKDQAVKEVVRLEEENKDLLAQIAPVTATVDKAQEARREEMTLKREWSKMFREVAVHAMAATGRLGVSGLSHPPSHDDEASFLDFFAKLVEKLEEAVTKMDELVDAECLELLELARRRIFSNLLHANPDFQAETVLKEVEELGLDKAAAAKLAEAIKGPVEKFLKSFQRPEEGGPSGEPQEGESSSGASEEVSGDESREA